MWTTTSLLFSLLPLVLSSRINISNHGKNNTSVQFVVIAARSNSPFHLQSVNANGQAFWIGKDTATYCPLEPHLTCPPGNETVFSVGGRTASLDTAVPGGQQIFVAPNGKLSYTQAHSPNIPPGSAVQTFSASVGTVNDRTVNVNTVNDHLGNVGSYNTVNDRPVGTVNDRPVGSYNTVNDRPVGTVNDRPGNIGTVNTVNDRTVNDPLGVFSFEGLGGFSFLACPSNETGPFPYQVFVDVDALSDKDVPSGCKDDCLDFGALTAVHEGDAAAWQYT
ncbi:MAG: hypothetical protein Q9166_003340 [cf. Caloplaca sp. 2 TL-2023]